MRMESLQTLTPAPWAPIFAIECRLTDNCSFSKGPCLQKRTSIALFSGEKTIQHQSKQSHIPKPGAAAAHSKPHIVRSQQTRVPAGTLVYPLPGSSEHRCCRLTLGRLEALTRKPRLSNLTTSMLTHSAGTVHPAERAC